MIQFVQCTFSEIENEVCRYYEEKDILVDSFWEDHVCESTYYHIKKGEENIGYCGIYHKSLMTLFYVDEVHSYLAQEIFMKARRLEEIFEAFVPTGDELLLSLALDNFSTLGKQAYFTRYKKAKIAKDETLQLELATLEKQELVERYSEGFFDDISREIGLEKLYIAKKEDEIVGFGIIEKGRIRRDLASIGMFVRPQYRQRGVGKNILIGLKEIVELEGRFAISGCWYYNHNSLKTQLSLGNDCATRLLRIKF